MDKTVDIMKRTFEQEKKEFSLICRVFEAVCVVVMCTLAIIMIGLVCVSIVMGAGMSDVIVVSVNSAVLLFGMASALNFGRAIFKTLKSGETPFRYDIADKVRGASLALLLSGLVEIVVHFVSDPFSEAFRGICHYYFLIAIASIFIGLLLGIMSYVMNYGCKLQQESDETI